MSYPTSLPSYAGFTSTHTLSADSHAAQHNSEQTDILGLATKVGTGAATPTSGVLLRGNGVGTSTWDTVHLGTDVSGQLPSANATNVLQAVYPVGCVYIETIGVNPNTTFGFGTWTQTGQGRVLVGQGTSDQLFTAGATGGESNHTLTSNEMPSHSHVLTDPGHTHTTTAPANSTVGGNPNFFAGNNSGSFSPASSNNTTGITMATTGGGANHNNLQPYQVVYYWQRTA